MIRATSILFSMLFLFTFVGCPAGDDDDSAAGGDDDDTALDDDDATADDDDATADDDDSAADDDDSVPDDDDTTDDDDSVADDDDSVADDDDIVADDDDIVADDDDSVAGSTAAPGDVVVTEIMKNPLGADDLREWFELFNATGTDIDLENWRIYDLDFDSHVIAGSLVLPADGYLVLGVTDVLSSNGEIPVDYAYGQGEIVLGNGGDELYVEDSAGNLIDSVEWNDTDFPDREGAALNLDVNTLDAVSNDDGVNWCDATTPVGILGDLGTPGSENTACGATGDDDDSAVGDDDDSAVGDDDDSAALDDDDSAVGDDDDDSAVLDDDDSAVLDDDDSALLDDDDSALLDDDDSALPADDDDSALAISFATDVAPIVFANCSCHASGAGGWSHNNDAATLYAAWVNTPALASASGLDRIEPGSRASSFVWKKITADLATGEGQPMPRGGPGLLTADPTSAETIGLWIDGGALDN